MICVPRELYHLILDILTDSRTVERPTKSTSLGGSLIQARWIPASESEAEQQKMKKLIHNLHLYKLHKSIPSDLSTVQMFFTKNCVVVHRCSRDEGNKEHFLALSVAGVGARNQRRRRNTGSQKKRKWGNLIFRSLMEPFSCQNVKIQ